MAHVKFSIQFCYLDSHNNYQLLFSGSLPDTLTIHYVALSEDRKRMKLKQVKKKRNWEKGKKLSQYCLCYFGAKYSRSQFKQEMYRQVSLRQDDPDIVGR